MAAVNVTWPSEVFYPHTVRIRDALPAGGMSAGYGPPRTRPAEVKDTQTVVLGTDGREVVSSATVSLPLPEHVALLSLVTVWPGTPREREALVLAASVNPNEPPLDAFLLLSLK